MISVIVPSYNRPHQLTGCLQALADLEDSGDRFEVVIVDDGGEAPLDPVISAFRERLDVALVRRTHAGAAAARNTGAARARGRHLAFLDDDCAPAPSWLRRLATRLADRPDDAVGGRTLNALPDNLYSTASQLLIDYLYEYYSTSGGPAFFASNNLALPRDGFRAIGGFDVRFPGAAGEDRDLCDRWLRHGFRMTYAPDVLVYHAHTLTLRTFWTQHFNYGRAAFSFRSARARRAGRIRLEPLAFYGKLLQRPFVGKRGRQAPSLAAALLVSQVANAGGFLWEGTRRARRQ